MKKRLKQIFLFILFILGIGLVTLIAIPLLFKDEIVQAIKTVANDELSAVVDFEEVGLSFFHDFPNLSVDIQNLSVTGIEEFEGTVLYSAPRSIFNLDLKSIFKKDQIGTINTIELRDPTIQLIITKEGIENYNIAKSTKTSNAPEAYEIDLSAFEVVNADFLYRDESSNISTVLEGIQISGKASLRGDIYNFDYQGSINQSSIKSSGITYLNQVHTKLKGVAIMDLSNSKFEFESNELVLNDLDMRMSGWVQNKPSATLMDIEFESADNKFKKMWSLVPQAYTTNFPDAQIDGNMSINGYIRGTYDDQVTQLPSFEIDIKANNGTVSYPKAPESLQNIHADIKISSPGDLDQLQIDVPRLDFTLADNPVRGRFSVRNVQSNPAIDMALKGEIELEKLASVLGPDNTADLSGTIDCDVQVKGKQSDIQNRAYQNTLISGYLNIDDLKYSDANSPDLHLLSLKSNFSPSKLKIHSISGQLGRTDINAEAEVNNVISLLTPGQRVTGSVQWSSNLVDLNEWMTGAESEADTLKIPIELPTNFQFSVDANANTLLYSDYDMQDVKIKGTIDNGDLVIRQLSSQLGESDIYVSGRLNNTMNYLFGNETLSGMMNVRSSHLNLNTLMPSSSDQDNTQGERAPILVPKNVNVLVNAEIGSLLYDDINMSNLKGALAVAEQEARIENMTAQAFDGTFDLNGGYDSKNEERPQFDIDYTLKKFDFRKTFEKVNTFKI
ncbi:MAG: hypothetical protein KJP00_03735, partial [Bacteroidia bacterium]|nr:hypothetical protein [Bacteroidia bacterium]